MTDDAEGEERHRETLWLNAYTGQMALLWQQFQYIQVVAFGTWLAWFYLRKTDYLISVSILIIGALFQYIILPIIRRHAQILTELTNRLENRGLIGQDLSLRSPRSFLMTRLFSGNQDRQCEGGSAYTAHRLARLSAVIVIFVNIATLLLTIADKVFHLSSSCSLTIVTSGILAIFLCTKSWLSFLIFSEKRSIYDPVLVPPQG